VLVGIVMVASTTGTTLSPGTMPHNFLRHRENMPLKVIEDPIHIIYLAK